MTNNIDFTKLKDRGNFSDLQRLMLFFAYQQETDNLEEIMGWLFLATESQLLKKSLLLFFNGEVSKSRELLAENQTLQRSMLVCCVPKN